MPESIFDVHLFPVVRLKVSGITADSSRQAIDRALEQPFSASLDRALKPLNGEFADELSHYLVDREGDPAFEHSEWFHSHEEVVLSDLRALVEWADGTREPSALEAVIEQARQTLSCVV